MGIRVLPKTCVSWFYLVADVLQQFEVLCVHPEVFQDLRMVHVVWVVSGDGEVTVTHHLLGDVDGQGAVDAGSLRF